MRGLGWKLLSALALLALADCSQAPANTAAAPAAPKAPAAPTPAWATALIGKAVTDAFPKTGVCIGFVDKVDTTTAPSTLSGWAWDTAGKKVIPHILVADEQGNIVGAGESGGARPDVPAARPDVTTPNVGWSAPVGDATGQVKAYGVIGSDTVCSLGQKGL